MSRTILSFVQRTLMLLLLVPVLAACRQPAAPTPAPAQAAAAALGDAMAAAELVGTSWQAIAFGGAGDAKPVDPNTSLTLNFGADRYLGSGGCNWFLGVYDVNGDQMELRAPSQTVFQCQEPPNVMQQESMYLSALWNIVAYRKLEENLLAYATDDQLLLTFAPMPPAPLAGTTWSLKFQLADEQITPAIADTTVTATFAEGSVAGSAGCNTYKGSYTLDGDKLTIGDLAVTKQACAAPDGAMDQEQRYLANLAAATRLVQTGDVLQLLNADGETMLAFGPQ